MVQFGPDKEGSPHMAMAPERMGIGIRRHFTTAGVDPYETVTWERRDARITNFRDGTVAFEQLGVEVPSTWSVNATNILAQKYFRGPLGAPEREHSLKQVADRVVDTITAWGVKDGYFLDRIEADAFRDELKYLIVHQMAAFNSPVWFNIGVKGVPQQASACQPYEALVSTPEGLVPIGRLVEEQAVGAKVYDANGVTRIVAVKANGRKHVLRVHLKSGYNLDVTPDHLVWRVSDVDSGRFVEAGTLRAGDRLQWHRRPSWGIGEITAREIAEAALAGWLQSDGFVGQYQGTNRSLTIEAMTVNAAERTWVEAAIDAVFPDTHRHERRVPTQDASLDCRRLWLYGNGLADFVDRWGLRARRLDMRVPEHLFTAPLPVVAAYLRSLFQAEGYISIRERAALVGLDMISEELVRGVQRLLLRFGIFSRVRRKAERRSDRQDIWSLAIRPLGDRARFAAEIDFLDERKAAKLEASLDLPGIRTADTKTLEIERIEDLGETEVYDIQTESGEYLSDNLRVHNCFILSVEDSMRSILNWYVEEGIIFKGGSGAGINLSRIRSSQEHLNGGGTASGPVSFMRGADASAGTIKSGGKTRRAAKMVILNADHPDIEDFIWCKAVEERKARALRDAGFDMDLDGKDSHSTQYQNANNSVRVTDEFMQAVVDDADWDLRAVTSGGPLRTVKARDLLRQIAKAAWECADPGMQFDTTINRWHTAATTGRINGSNPCSEYMHLDNSACNLASLNLLTFLGDDDIFDVEGFKVATEVVFTAQEILVGNADYPTEAIAATSRRFRQLGIGYANLGALLMAQGMAYDSDDGRAWAAAITALLTGHSYATSARTAARMGPFAGYTENAEHMNRVLRMHRDEVAKIDEERVQTPLLDAAQEAWDTAVELGERYGVRNSQASVLAPTGCLVGGTLVATDRGLVRLRSLGDPDGPQWQGLDAHVLTDDGVRQATKFFVNGLEQTVDVVTARGYRVTGTTRHRVKVVDGETGQWEWRHFSDLRPGDLVPLALGQVIGEPQEVVLPPLSEKMTWAGEHHVDVPRTMSPELAELIGYFMGDGSLHSRGLRLCVADGDFDVVEHLSGLAKSLFGIQALVRPAPGHVVVELSSVRLAEWWQACGFAKRRPAEGHRGKGYVPHIPDAVLAANDRETYRAFLRGLFEADGTVVAGYPSWTTSSSSFAAEVQTLLLALGFVTTVRGMTSGRGSRLHMVRLLNQAANERWLAEVGFLSGRKAGRVQGGSHPQSARHDHIPVTRALLDRVVPDNDRDRKVALMEYRRSGSITRRLAATLHDRTGDAELGRLLGFFFDRVASAQLGEEELTYDISVPENVTYVANGFVSHNTIGLLMDCDTTGIEPDLGLVKMKKLVGGGTMSIVNQTIPRALRRLGYSDGQVDDIVAWIDEHKTILGAPHLAADHYPIFACSMGDNTIHYLGHVRMMAAVQPFISGAISKTVNMPEDATVEDVEQLHIDAWKMGLKAIAIYRDNCKVAQPLSTVKKDAVPGTPEGHDAELAQKISELEQALANQTTVVVKQPIRQRLPRRRKSNTFAFRIADCEGYVTVGEYEDGRPGEVFMKVSKQGSTLAGIMDAFSISVSLGLQHGVPLRTYVQKYTNMRFEPAGMTDDPDLRIASSLVDYIFRRLAVDYMDRAERAELGILTTEERIQPTLPGVEEGATPSAGIVESALAAGAAPAEIEAVATPVSAPAPVEVTPAPAQSDAPFCMQCGVQMIRAGSCHACPSCGTTSGCS
jgi:ribonucleoside-diphosphate reductase alpha chain